MEYLRGGRKRIKYGPCTKVYASTCPVSPSFAQLYEGRCSKPPSSKVTHSQCMVEFTFMPSCVHFASVLLTGGIAAKTPPTTRCYEVHKRCTSIPNSVLFPYPAVDALSHQAEENRQDVKDD